MTAFSRILGVRLLKFALDFFRTRVLADLEVCMCVCVCVCVGGGTSSEDEKNDDSSYLWHQRTYLMYGGFRGGGWQVNISDFQTSAAGFGQLLSMETGPYKLKDSRRTFTYINCKRC